jgi:hypothetical protein
MTKWVLFALSLIGFAVMYGTTSTPLVFIGMALGLGCLVAGILVWMDERIRNVSRSQTYIPTAEEVQVIRRIHEKRARPAAPRDQPSGSSNTA